MERIIELNAQEIKVYDELMMWSYDRRNTGGTTENIPEPLQVHNRSVIVLTEKDIAIISFVVEQLSGPMQYAYRKFLKANSDNSQAVTYLKAKQKALNHLVKVFTEVKNDLEKGN